LINLSFGCDVVGKFVGNSLCLAILGGSFALHSFMVQSFTLFGQLEEGISVIPEMFHEFHPYVSALAPVLSMKDFWRMTRNAGHAPIIPS